MTKLLKSQSQAWEIMLSENAMYLTLPIYKPTEDQKREKEGG